MKYIQFAIFICLIILVGFSVFAPITFAAGLVPCGNPGQSDCTVCDFFSMADGIIKFVSVDIAPALALILIVIGAIIMMTAAGSQTNYDKGKSIITLAIIGIFIIWGSWLIIDTVMKAFPNVETEFGPWNEIECE